MGKQEPGIGDVYNGRSCGYLPILEINLIPSISETPGQHL